MEFPFPSLLLLDLKMPRADGFDVLTRLRKQEGTLRRLPVVVFSASDAPKDINRVFDSIAVVIFSGSQTSNDQEKPGN
jgi:CheY-like chemotaxis protein